MNKTKAINMICFLFVVVFMVAMNSLVPYCCDDWHYMFVLHDQDYKYQLDIGAAYMIPDVNERLVSSFADVITSTKNQYFVMGGRAINHFFEILLLWLTGKWLFNILNSFMFALLGYFIYKLAVPKKKGAMPWLLPLVYLLIFLMPDIGDNVFWMAGAVNYLWPSVIMTGTWLVMNKCFYSESKLKFALMLPLVLLASSTNEISGGMMGIILLVWFLADEKKKKNFFRYLICVLLFIAGEAFVLAAPGNFNRAKNFNQIDIGDKKGIIWACTHNLSDVLNNYGWMILIMGALWVFFRQMLKRDEIRMLSYAAGGLVGSVAYGLSGIKDYRVLFYPVSMLFVSFVICAVKLYECITADHDGIIKDYYGKIKEYLSKHWLRDCGAYALLVYVFFILRGTHQFVINTLSFGFAFFWLFLYSRKVGGFGNIGARGLFEYLCKKVWIIMVGVLIIPWIYYVIMGKDSLDGALHYLVVAVKVCAVMLIVWLIKWSVDSNKLEKPKNKRLLDLYKRYDPKALKKRFADSPARLTAIAIKCVMIFVSVLMTSHLADNTIDVIPYYSKARALYEGAEQAAQTDSKIYQYNSKVLLYTEGNSSIMAINRSTLEIGHIPASWIEEYYGITIVVKGIDSDLAWSANNLGRNKKKF